MNPAAPVTRTRVTLRSACGSRRSPAASPSSSATRGSHLRTLRATEMSGRRTFGSSVGSGRVTSERFRSGQPEHQLRQLPDRELVGVADVGRLVPVAREEPVDPLDEIGDVAERSRLRAVAVQRERLTLERLHHEVGNHPAVLRPHPRSVRVEDAHDARIDPVIAVVGHRHRLGEPLRLVVHAARADRIHVSPVASRAGDAPADRRTPRTSTRAGTGRPWPWRDRAPCGCPAIRP